MKELLKDENYWKRFEELSRECKSYKDAYLELENEFFEMYTIHKYSTYDSFREAKFRWQKIVRRKNR